MTEEELKIKGFELFVTRERLQNNLTQANNEIQKVINELGCIERSKTEKEAENEDN